MKKWLNFIGFAIGAICFYIFFNFYFDWQATKILLADSQISSVCLSMIFFFMTLSLRAFKWTYILKLKEHVAWANGYHTIMISNLVNFIFPIRFGEIFKFYLINIVSGVTYSSSISTSLTDKLSHLLIIIAFLFLTPMAGFEFSEWSVKFVLFLIPFIVVFILFFFIGNSALNIFVKGLKVLLSFSRIKKWDVNSIKESKVFIFIRTTMEKTDISTLTKVNLLVVISFSFATILIDGICFYFIINAFGVAVTWLQGSLAACFLNLMFVLPTPPGQLGTAEMYPLLIFSWGLGLSPAVITSAAILWHLITTCVFVILGIYSTISLGVDMRSILQRFRKQKGQVHE